MYYFYLIIQVTWLWHVLWLAILQLDEIAEKFYGVQYRVDYKAYLMTFLRYDYRFILYWKGSDMLSTNSEAKF